jgi:anti-sigma28 factor (negative regulator of flagellin synthesis)
MISGVNASTVGRTYANSMNENKDIKPNAKLTASKDGSLSKLEQLKESIDSGEYKVDLSALSEKIADQLL